MAKVHRAFVPQELPQLERQHILVMRRDTSRRIDNHAALMKACGSDRDADWWA